MGNGAAKRTVKDAQAEGFQQLKLAVHNRLFETLDVTRLESLEPAMASQKVTEAISAILDDEGRLLTDTDKQSSDRRDQERAAGTRAARAAAVGR